MATLMINPVMFTPMQHTPTSSNTRATLEQPRSELLCRYPSKQCDNIRSEKRGGGLHRFCAFHRERANINQRRVDHRRRLRRRAAMQSESEASHSHHDNQSATSDDDMQFGASDLISLDHDLLSFDGPLEPLGAALSEEDLQVLINLLDRATPTDNLSFASDSHARTIKEENPRSG
ncbi:hypothetical protein P43SY_008704 [Pythium insidiosum]|uniref:Uncharacterized protein n=1 Tax=Pythium insidiosum TaxID=114742 RepID=A0AAD5Q810_PYTIN|nr:hypothetical protein P43SY_008704 [Pythium insidiosum]